MPQSLLVRDLSIFLVVQIAMIFFSHAEAYQEGKEGWKWNPKWWRIRLPAGYWYTAYHIFIFFITLPLLVFGIPLILVGWDTHLFLILLVSYLVGTTLEDFTWFLVNRDYPFSKWNPKDTRWYPWVALGRLSLPLSYVIKITIATLLSAYIF